jgi:hypothetical protein
MSTKKMFCDSCKKRNINQEMLKINLDLEQTRKKLIYGKINAPPMIVFLGYDYYECPICNWFKFVNINKYELVKS